MSCLVANTEDRYSRDVAQLYLENCKPVIPGLLTSVAKNHGMLSKLNFSSTRKLLPSFSIGGIMSLSAEISVKSVSLTAILWLITI